MSNSSKPGHEPCPCDNLKYGPPDANGRRTIFIPETAWADEPMPPMPRDYGLEPARTESRDIGSAVQGVSVRPYRPQQEMPDPGQVWAEYPNQSTFLEPPRSTNPNVCYLPGPRPEQWSTFLGDSATGGPFGAKSLAELGIVESHGLNPQQEMQLVDAESVDVAPKDVYGPDGVTPWPNLKEKDRAPWSAEGGPLKGKHKEFTDADAKTAPGQSPASFGANQPAKCAEKYYFYYAAKTPHVYCEDCEEVATGVQTPEGWDPTKTDPDVFPTDKIKNHYLAKLDEAVAKCVAQHKGRSAQLFRGAMAAVKRGDTFPMLHRNNIEYHIAELVESMRCGARSDGTPCLKKKVEILYWRANTSTAGQNGEMYAVGTGVPKDVDIDGKTVSRLHIKTRICIPYRMEWEVLYSVECIV